MSADFFFDTNILVYAVNGADPEKKRTALNLLLETQSHDSGCISFQVVQEFINIALKRFRPTMAIDDLRTLVHKSLLPICRIKPSGRFYQDALDTHQLTRFSWYDSLILQAAVDAGCGTLYSEDLQDGFQYRGVTVKNPFRTRSARNR